MKRTLFLQNRPIAGIDISHTYIKEMSINTSKWRVTSYGSVTVDPLKIRDSLMNDPSYLTTMLQDLVSKNLIGRMPSDQVIVSIPTSMTYSRSITLPSTGVKKLEDAVSLEAEQYIPVPVNDLNLSYEILSKTAKETELLMSAAPKKIINNVIEACNQANLTPLLVQPSINSVARLITLTEEGHLPTVIVDIGATNTDLAILNEKIRANASTQVGGNTFTYAISKKLKTSLENAHQLKVLNGLALSDQQKAITSALQPSLKQIVDEVKKIIRYYSERLTDDSKIEQVVIVGSGASVPGIGDYFTNELLMPARVASPWQALDFGDLAQPAKQFRARYITVAGLATIRPKEVQYD